MKLSEYAQQQGVDYKTAYRWFRKGIIPLRTTQLPTGTILVHTEDLTPTSSGVALYARVSSHDQKGDLDRQLARLVQHATSANLAVVRSVSEIGSGLNGHRGKLLSLLRDPAIGVIVVEHRDRLARFGSEYIEAALAAAGRKLIIVDDGEATHDLIHDAVDVMTSLCASLYGHRSAKNRAKRALESMQKES